MRDRLYVHITWTTRGRRPLIDATVAEFLESYLARVARQERARIVELGILSTHLHLLVRLHPTTNIPRLLQRFKGGSATIANRHAARMWHSLQWAKGYNIQSVSAGVVDAVRAYVRNQPQRHPDEVVIPSTSHRG